MTQLDFSRILCSGLERLSSEFGVLLSNIDGRSPQFRVRGSFQCCTSYTAFQIMHRRLGSAIPERVPAVTDGETRNY
jgi:hypothetical protein